MNPDLKSIVEGAETFSWVGQNTCRKVSKTHWEHKLNSNFSFVIVHFYLILQFSKLNYVKLFSEYCVFSTHFMFVHYGLITYDMELHTPLDLDQGRRCQTLEAV